MTLLVGVEHQAGALWQGHSGAVLEVSWIVGHMESVCLLPVSGALVQLVHLTEEEAVKQLGDKQQGDQQQGNKQRGDKQLGNKQKGSKEQDGICLTVFKETLTSWGIKWPGRHCRSLNRCIADVEACRARGSQEKADKLLQQLR